MNIVNRLAIVAVIGLCLTQVIGGDMPNVDKGIGRVTCWEEDEAMAAGIDMPIEPTAEAGGMSIDELRRKAALWEHAGWRAQVHLVRERIEDVSDHDAGVYHDDHIQESEYIARAFVRTARELGLPLWTAVAVAEMESKFDHSAIGGAGEVSVMQVKPYPNRPMAKIKADPAYAIEWAMTNCFMPGYSRARVGEGGDPLSAIGHGLKHYNGSAEYVDRVMKLKAQSYTDKLWDCGPE